jgi:hypothetical protein
LPSLYGGATKAGVKALDLYNAAITCHATGASAGDAIANFGITCLLTSNICASCVPGTGLDECFNISTI